MFGTGKLQELGLQKQIGVNRRKAGNGKERSILPGLCSLSHRAHVAQLQISFTGERGTPLSYKASLERGLFAYQGDWRFLHSKTS